MNGARSNHPNHPTVIRHFGTWARALHAAGLDQERVQRRRQLEYRLGNADCATRGYLIDPSDAMWRFRLSSRKRIARLWRAVGAISAAALPAKYRTKRSGRSDTERNDDQRARPRNTRD
jgi:hypothetical protein